MFSEIFAEHEASCLEKVLLKAIDTKDQEVINFCKKYVYGLYRDAAAEAWGSYNSDNREKINEVYRK